MFRLTFVHPFSLFGASAAEYVVCVNVDNGVDVMNLFLLEETMIRKP